MVTDQQWSAICAVLQPEDRCLIGGRDAVAAMLRKLRSGCRWEDLPSHYGDVMAIAELYTAWCEEALWPQIFAALMEGGGSFP